MKTTDLTLLTKSFPVYLLLIPHDEERKRAIKQITFHFKEEISSFEPGQFHLVKEEVQQLSLFADSKLVILDRVEEYSAKDVADLEQLMVQHRTGISFVLGAGGKKGLAKLLTLSEKLGVVIDLSSEKPWERDKRLLQTIQELAKTQGKLIATEAGSYLLERIGPEPLLLEQEIYKLVSFIGDKGRIEKGDIDLISSSLDTETLWQVAGRFVWDEAVDFGEELDASGFFTLVSSLRIELRLGFQMARLLEEGVEDLSPHFPKVWPKVLEKKRAIAQKKGSYFFKKGLIELFSIELKAKEGLDCYGALLLNLLKEGDL